MFHESSFGKSVPPAALSPVAAAELDMPSRATQGAFGHSAAKAILKTKVPRESFLGKSVPREPF